MKLNKIFKWGMVAMILISVAVLVWSFVTGFKENDGKAVDVLLYWAYIVLGIAVFCWIVIGLIRSAKNDPKSLIKTGLVLVGAVAVCAIAYALAAGNPAVGYTGKPVTTGWLKITDTILIISGFAGAAAILAIIVGEVRMSIVNKK